MEDGVYRGILSVLTDISQLKVAEQELAAAHDRLTRANEQLSLLLRHTVDAQEEERRRIATDIHDELLQSIIGALYQTQIAQQRLEDGDPEAIQSVTSARDILNFVTNEIRRLIFDLRPLGLDEMGLVPALRKYLSDYEDTWHIHGRLRVSGHLRRLSLAQETVIFRIVQEALNNVRKHAKTDAAFISLHFGPRQLTVAVRDAGRGFDVRQTRSAPGQNLGLIGIRERARSIGGKVTIQSSPNVGTKITLRVALEVA
jgi:two-component system sensor histidine kinase DegS